MSYATPMRKEQKSKIIRTCKGCGAFYEVEQYAPHDKCEYCNPPKRCSHGKKLTEDCASCWEVHHNRLMRVLPLATKVVRKAQ